MYYTSARFIHFLSPPWGDQKFRWYYLGDGSLIGSKNRDKVDWWHGTGGATLGAFVLVLSFPLAQLVGSYGDGRLVMWKKKTLMESCEKFQDDWIIAISCMSKHTVYIYILPLNPKTMKNEGFEPPIYGWNHPQKWRKRGFPWYVYIIWFCLCGRTPGDETQQYRGYMLVGDSPFRICPSIPFHVMKGIEVGLYHSRTEDMYVKSHVVTSCYLKDWGSMRSGVTLLGTSPYPLPVGTFESMIFRLSSGGIWIRSLESICLRI